MQMRKTQLYTLRDHLHISVEWLKKVMKYLISNSRKGFVIALTYWQSVSITTLLLKSLHI